MKYKTTKKAIKENYYYIIGIGYCDAQHLLQFQTPESYCSGTYGWNCDIYGMHDCKYNIAISTGYNYIHGLDYNSDDLRELDKKAEKIIYGDLPIEEKKNTVNKMLYDFCNNLVEKNNK